MTYDLLTALIAFAFVTSVTPGPNNLMLMASGANFGFRRSIPHMLGISIGFVGMVALIGLGLGRIFDIFPVSYVILKVLSVAFLLYLAFKIATAAPIEEGAATGHPLTFLQAAAFQWVNPKAWAMAIGAITAYAAEQSWQSVLIVAAVFGAVNLPSITLWTTLGREAKRVLTSPERLRLFNWTMAGLLVASLWPVLTGL
ncbi:LysE family translocator [Halovulum sp. GXIMD14793]